MKYMVTPEFSQKIGALPKESLAAISAIVAFIDSSNREQLIAGTKDVETRALGNEIISIKNKNHYVYASFVSNEVDPYLILLDTALESNQTITAHPVFTTRDPRNNILLDPNKNMQIDPRRNMLIDPNRNMWIDPNRNMWIDPRRNMWIDPNRNMWIDPKRNMWIDPNRNMSIDPNRNMLIDPRRNAFFGGPYVYTANLERIGFVVRANEQVSLIFNLSGTFSDFFVSNSPSVERGTKSHKEAKWIANVFDTNNSWNGFLVAANEDVLLRFDYSGRWIGLIV